MNSLPSRPEQQPVSAGNLAAAAVFLAVFTLLTWAGCSLAGHYNLDWSSWQHRAYRLVAAATVGAGLALAGVTLQHLLQTPLADPFLLGVSPGAGAGMVVALILGPAVSLPDWASAPLSAMVGAIVVALTAFILSRRDGKTQPTLLMLAGLILCILCYIALLCLLMFSRRYDLAGFVGWSMGKLPGWLWDQPKLVISCAVWVVGGWALLLFRARPADICPESGLPMVSSRWLWLEAMIVSSLITAATVALAGPMGFVGLIVPALCRRILRNDRRLQLLFCGFFGAVFVMLTDTLCRLGGEWANAGEIPSGIISAALGAPLLLFMLRRQRDAR